MALLERVAALLRANLHDLIDRAEDPVKMLNQVILDMENQLLQVKTQVAIAVADLHNLELKKKESSEREADWTNKADIAIKKGDDALARAALERAVASRELAAGLAGQVADQKVQVENLRAAFGDLQTKLAETRPQLEVLKVQQRRARGVVAAIDHPTVEERFSRINKEEEIERILLELKAKNGRA